MTVNVLAKGFVLFDTTKEYINETFEKMNKKLNIDPNYRVVIKKRLYGEYECTISTYAHSRSFNVRVTRKGIAGCFESAAKDLKKMILAYTDKLTTKKVGAKIESAAAEVEEKKAPVKVCGDKITKTKSIHLTPISDEDAIDKLVNSDKDMFMYLDESTLAVKGVYMRTDGYGVITFENV